MQTQILNEFTKTKDKTRFNQGDILKDLSLIIQTDYNFDSQKSTLSEITLNYAVLINQECDLEHDFNARNKIPPNQDKFLPNIFILPAYLSNNFKQGIHRGKEMKCTVWGGDKWKNIQNNQHPRFHSIKANEDYQIPDLIIDFKHLYTVSRDLLYKNINNVYFVSICEIYRESLSQRYSYYLSRIGLPERK